MCTPSVLVSSDVHAPPARATTPAGSVPSLVTTAVTVPFLSSTSRPVAPPSTTRNPRETAARRRAALRTLPSIRRAAGLNSARRTGARGGKEQAASSGEISTTSGERPSISRAARSMNSSSPGRSATRSEPVTA